MIPIPIFWTNYTTTYRGQIYKLVPCEHCKGEYIYLLEREAMGSSTSFYFTNEDGASQQSRTSAKESLQSYLENDYDPIPCPTCGQYQKFMFPKLMESKSFGYPIATVVLLVAGTLTFIGVLHWPIEFLLHRNDHAFRRMILTWSILLLLSPIIYFLHRIKRKQIQRFDPNRDEDQRSRIAKGKERAVSREDFEKQLQLANEAKNGS